MSLKLMNCLKKSAAFLAGSKAIGWPLFADIVNIKASSAKTPYPQWSSLSVLKRGGAHSSARRLTCVPLALTRAYVSCPTIVPVKVEVEVPDSYTERNVAVCSEPQLGQIVGIYGCWSYFELGIATLNAGIFQLLISVITAYSRYLGNRCWYPFGFPRVATGRFPSISISQSRFTPWV